MGWVRAECARVRRGRVFGLAVEEVISGVVRCRAVEKTRELRDTARGARMASVTLATALKRLILRQLFMLGVVGRFEVEKRLLTWARLESEVG